MLSRRQLALVSVLVLAGLGAVFLLLDFRIASSRTQVEDQVATYSFGFEKNESLPANSPLSLVVQDQDSLARAVAGSLEKRFLAGPIPAVTLEDTVQADIEHFQVVIEIVDRTVIWSPFYAQARLTVNFAFSSNGDLSWRDENVFTATSDDGQLVGVSGELQLLDRTVGLISRPGFNTHLANELAVRIEEAILKALASPTNPSLGNLK